MAKRKPPEPEPEVETRPTHQYYDIVAIEDGLGYLLFNNASGARCGDRLFRGENDKNRKERWPFWKVPAWWEYDNKEEAEAAALKLQAYLCARAPKKKKT